MSRPAQRVRGWGGKASRLPLSPARGRQEELVICSQGNSM